MWRRLRLCVPGTVLKVKHCRRKHIGFASPNNDSKRGVSSVESILAEVERRDGLCPYIPHIEYLVGSSRKAFGGENGGTLDISDKTHYVLQSSHPVRFLVEREIRSMGEENFKLKYMDWVVLFGRSLVPPVLKSIYDSESGEKSGFEDKLRNIGTAAECGMFCSDVHQSVVNISGALSPSKVSELNLGNKYAVLVGDFFAIKTIYFAEKVKSSPVLLDIVRGVEDFSYSTFVSNLIDWDVGYPFLPKEGAALQDWLSFGLKSSGYFTGGLNAAFTLNALQERRLLGEKLPYLLAQAEDGEAEEVGGMRDLQRAVSCLALTLKAIADLQSFEFDRDQLSEGSDSVTPFLFISLPAILYQEKNRGAFREFKDSNFKLDLGRVLHMQQKIADSEAIPATKRIIQEFCSATIQSMSRLGLEPFYAQTLQDLLKTISYVDKK